MNATGEHCPTRRLETNLLPLLPETTSTPAVCFHTYQVND
jgi:hypothetical protein